MKHYIYLSLIIIMGMLVGCSDEILITDPTTPTISGDYYFVLSGMSSQTRAIDYQSDTHSVFSEGDVLGAFAINEAENSALYTNLGTNEANNNVKYKVKNVSGGQVLVPVDETKQLPKGATYIFYYPYNEDFTSSSTESIQYSSWNNAPEVRYKIQANQNSVEGEAEHKSANYEKSDLLWDVVSATTGGDNVSRVHVEMDHVMANIILKIPSNLIKKGSDVKIISRQLYGIEIPLYKSGRTDGALDASWTYNTGANAGDGNAENTDITMWKYDTDEEEGITTYRAVVLATNDNDNDGKLIAKTQWPNQNVFSIVTPDGTKKEYGVKNTVILEHGKNYIFQVTSGSDEPLIPIPTDDDSWVLDVYNKKGEIVGLLCREYLLFQPNGYEYPTGTSYSKDGSITANADTRCINAQAWVLYKLKPNMTPLVPDLSTGTVLRFIYDVAYCGSGSFNNIEYKDKWANEDGTLGDQSNYNIWPLPHLYTLSSPCVFSCDHGHFWNYYTDGVEGKYDESKRYGKSSSAEHQFYMHGGTITWGYTGESAQLSKEKIIGITSFTMPTEKITNETAKAYGHITWDEENKKVDISYDATDRNACTLVPHTLKDDKDGIEYPLVKIGYNQFWMSKSYRGTKYRENGEIKDLQCFNDTENNLDENATGVTETVDDTSKAIAFYSEFTDKGAWKEPVLSSAKVGYMYPFVDRSSDTKDKGIYNPAYYNAQGDTSQMHYKWDVNTPEGTLSYEHYAIPLYNKATVDLKGFVPIANTSTWNIEYTLPGLAGYEKIISYYDLCLPIAKFGSNKFNLRNKQEESSQDEYFKYNYYTSALRGETIGYYGSNTATAYNANISGFNAIAAGQYLGSHSGWGMDGVAGYCTFIMKSSDAEVVNLLKLPAWSMFQYDIYGNSAQNYSGFIKFEHANSSSNVNAFFGQVRFVMHFLNNELSETTPAKTRAAETTKKKQSEDVYITITE